MIQKSTRLKYEPSSELLLITAKQLFLNRVLYLAVHWMSRASVFGAELGGGGEAAGSGKMQRALPRG